MAENENKKTNLSKETNEKVEKVEAKDKKRDSDSGDNPITKTSKTYYAEYKKIVWPSTETLVKHTVTVITVSLIFGAYIALMDGVFNLLFGRFVNLLFF